MIVNVPASRCTAVYKPSGDRCELQAGHSYPKHQAHLSYHDPLPIVSWLADVGVTLAQFCQSEGPRGETICMLPLGHDGLCGWELLMRREARSR